jgi:poly-gamma-glutamate synthesis protein (capsule biosynthesis protein)
MTRKRKQEGRLIIAFILLLILQASLCGCGQKTEAMQQTHITVSAVGDLLIHNTVFWSVYDRGTGTYNFNPVFAAIAPYLKASDYCAANLETRLAGPQFGYSGYPKFNTPDSLAVDMRETGVDLMATANNHSLDMGWPGIVNTLDCLDAAGLAHIGTYRTPAEKANPLIVDVRGVKLAWLNYTAVDNGLSLPPDKSFALNFWDPRAAAEEIRKARQQGAELVIVIVHMGTEYQRTPNADQQLIVQQLAAAGADVVVNSHPHTVQPIEIVSARQADGTLHRCVVAYSLGNFIADQPWRYSDCGVILYLDIVKDSTGVRVDKVSYLPVWVQKREAGGVWSFRVLPVLSAASVLSDASLNSEEKRRMLQAWTDTTSWLNDPAQGILPYDKSCL